ncbi:SRPBCC family protein [Halobacillus sp. B23F22_1]|uniref:SRPBCC family protein n=1 Tax=Halobacillus sp. B23F22_1 TaxID=3459514 RepID=UPI00373E0135
MAENKVEVWVEGRDLVIERNFNAPQSLLFQVFSQSHHLEEWWGPQGWETENKTFEFKPGGSWHYCMRCVDKTQGDFYGQESWGLGKFQEISVPTSITYTDVFSDEKGNPSESMPQIVVTLNFYAQENGVKLRTRSEFATVEDLEAVKNMGVIEGMASQFECLDAYLIEIQ